ncbi:MAG TPA: DUF6569 family protein [Chryseosolibacter sp.]
MKYFIVLTVFAAFAANAQYKSENLKLDPQAAVTQNKYTYENLRLYPIRANKTFEAEHKNLGTYVSLKEALEKRKIIVSEKSRQGTVNSLLIENVSNDTIMILSGEVVQGGKQDRVVGEDVILYPKSGRKDVSVFCVEHGRWSPKNGDTSFKDYFSISTNEVRKAATVTKNQGEVWEKVAETTSKNRAQTSTGTLTALKESQTLSNELKRYTEHFQEALADDKTVIGLVAVSGDRILGCDMFASHAIFSTYLPGLLNSYSTEAITSGKPASISYEKVEEYLNDIIADEARQEEVVEKKGVMLKQGTKKIHISTF